MNNKENFIELLKTKYGSFKEALHDIGLIGEAKFHGGYSASVRGGVIKLVHSPSGPQCPAAISEITQADWGTTANDSVLGVIEQADWGIATPPTNKYQRNISSTLGITSPVGTTITIDVYDVLKAFDVTDPALQHLIKKALCAGLRGHKDRAQDLQDILDSAKRAVELGQS